MAEAAPFRGVRYNLEKAGEASNLVAPPYDVIGEDERIQLLAKSPYNVHHIDQSRSAPSGNGGLGGGEADGYRSAAGLFRRWLADGILFREDAPAFYLYGQEYTLPGAEGTEASRRRLLGLLAAVRLSPWSEGHVLPHERTFDGPKADRLRLMQTSRAAFSPVYSFYIDEERRLEPLLESAAAEAPAMEVQEKDGARHRLWALKDPQLHERIQEALKAHTLYIADGHHRYETALAYRDERRRERGVLEGAPWEFILMLVANGAGDGLTVLPTHRMVRLDGRIDEAQEAEAVRRLESWFRVRILPGPIGPSSPAAECRSAEDALAALGDGQQAMALYTGRSLWLLEPSDPRRLSEAVPGDHSPAWKSLGVTALHEIVLPLVFGLDKEAQAEGSSIRYTRDASEATAAVDRGDADLACLVQAPQPAQIRDVAEAGDAMPHKSTYFYPKVPTGLVFYDLEEA